MKNLFLVFTLLLTAIVANAQFTDVEKQELRLPINLQVNAGFENGKAGHVNSGGTFAVSLSSPIQGKASATFDASAASQYVRGAAYTVPEGLKGQACELSLDYIGADTNLALRVLDGTDTLITGASSTFAVSTVKATLSVYFLCPSSGSIKYEILSSADAAVVKYDNIQIGALNNLAETTLPDVFSAQISSAGTVSGENIDWINGNASIAVTSQYTLNFNSGIFSVAPTCVATPVNNTLTVTVQEFTAVTTSSGTWRTARTDTTAATAMDWKLVCRKSSTDAKQSVQVYKNVPRVAQNINEFSAKISSTDVVTEENVDWINGNCTDAGTGLATCNFNSSTFSVAPNCTCSVSNNSSTSCRVQTVSSTSLTTRVEQTTTGAVVDQPIVVSCQKASTDYKTPVVQPVVIGQVTQPGTSPLKISKAKLTAGQCSVSPCSPLLGVQGITSITRSATGTYAVNFETNYYSDASSIHCTFTEQTNVNLIGTFNTYTTTSVALLTKNLAGAASDSGIGVYCVGQ